MFRITKICDYGIVLLTHVALGSEGSLFTARELSTRTRIPLPVVTKVLKALTRNGILTSSRGAKGGYCLSRPPQEVSVAQIIAAVEGPIGMTDCTNSESSACAFEEHCRVRSHWAWINATVHEFLDSVTLAEMIKSPLRPIVESPPVLVEASADERSSVRYA